MKIPTILSVQKNSHPQDSSSSYILKTGQEAFEALEKQHKMIAQDSYKHLEKAGLSEGKIVWDMGCGTGCMTEYISKVVGPLGHVYAMDASKSQIEIAKKRLKILNIENVTFIHDDLTTIKAISFREADILYGRFIMMHVTNPSMVLKNILNLLKPGGTMALQESIMSSTCMSKRNKILEDYINAFIGLAKIKNTDFDIGNKLHILCKEAGFINSHVYYKQFKCLISEGKEILLNRISEWEEEAIKLGIVNRKKVDNWKDYFNNLKEDDFFYPAQQAYILAQKPN